MIQNHRKTIKTIKMIVVGVLICTVCLLLCATERSIAASAKDSRKRTVVPGTTQTPSKTAPSSTASPPSSIQKKEVVLPEMRKDLKADNLQVSKTEFSTGDSIYVSFDVHNLGNTIIAQASYKILLVLTLIDRVSLFDGTVNNLAPGSVTRVDRGITIPYNITPVGGGTLCDNCGLYALIDSAQTIAEENEENNQAYVSITLHLKRPDLTVTRWQLRGSTPQPGEMFDVDFTIKNIADYRSLPAKYYTTFKRNGPVPIDPAKRCYHAGCSDSQYGEEIISNRSYDIYPLNYNEIMEGSLRYRMPSTATHQYITGSYKVIISIDPSNELKETNETNNRQEIEFVIR